MNFKVGSKYNEIVFDNTATQNREIFTDLKNQQDPPQRVILEHLSMET